MLVDHHLETVTLLLAECTELEPPDDDGWLTPREQARQSALHVPKRRKEWRLGRWTAKTAVRTCAQTEGLRLEFCDIDIQVQPSGAPYASALGERFNLSLSHSNGMGICVVSRSIVPFGCDIELIEPRSDLFIRDYMTPEEQSFIEAAEAQHRPVIATLFWSSKESALKALQLGLRMDVRQLTVTSDFTSDCFAPPVSAGNDVWHTLTVQVQDRHTFRGWWSSVGGFIKTIIADCERQKRSGSMLPCQRISLFTPAHSGGTLGYHSRDESRSDVP